jgi:carbon storage regulator
LGITDLPGRIAAGHLTAFAKESVSKCHARPVGEERKAFMLVLSRRVGDEIIIETGADRITLVILDTDRGKVKIGIEAPIEFNIARAELLQQNPKEAAPCS